MSIAIYCKCKYIVLLNSIITIAGVTTMAAGMARCTTAGFSERERATVVSFIRSLNQLID